MPGKSWMAYERGAVDPNGRVPINQTFDPTLTAKDIIEIFNCTAHQATFFLKAYGFRIGGRYGITQSKLRFLQLSGEAMTFFASREKKGKHDEL